MFGVRVFRTKVTTATGRKALDVTDPLGDHVHLGDRVRTDLATLQARGLVSGLPNVNHPADWSEPLQPTRGEVQCVFDDWDSLAGRSLLIRLRFGYLGEFDVALARGASIDLHDKAAAITYRALLAVPEGGSELRLAVEAYDRRCPVNSLVAWLARVEYERNNSTWARLRVEQMRDPEKLRRMVRDTESFSAILKQSYPGSAGGSGGERVKLIHTTKDATKRLSVVDALLAAMDRGQGSGMVETIERIVGYTPESLDAAGLDFDKASIEVVDSDGEKKTLNLDTLRARFTYPLSHDRQLPDDVWTEQVQSVLTGPLSDGTDIQW